MYVEVKHTSPWTDFTLIMPVVSVGNVGQLAVDLLVSTLQPRKVGFFYDAAFWPIVGNDPYSAPGSTQGDIVTCCEVYEIPDAKTVLVQQRVPIIKYRRFDFRRKLMAWIKKNKFGKVVLLSSSNANSRIDSQLEGSKLRYLCTPAVDEATLNQLRGKLNWKLLERRVALPTPSSVQLQTELKGAEPTQVFIPGGGITKKVFLECAKEQIPLVVLMLFVSEGDGVTDALAMAAYLNEWLQVVQIAKLRDGNDSVRWKAWKVPPSWKLLFGNSAPVTIYW